MKKFLLLAVAAVIAGSASAQISTKKPAGRPHMLKEVPAMKSSKQTMNAVAMSKPGQMVKQNSSKKLVLAPAQKVKSSASAVAKANASSIRKVAELQESYIATGREYDFDAQSFVKVDPWTMGTATDEIGSTYLLDVIPNPFNGLEYVPVEYTINDGVLRIEPQEVVHYTGNDGNEYHVFIDGDTDDCSIEMTVGEDGSLTIDNTLRIYYDVFASEDFDPDFKSVADGGTYVGVYSAATGLNYLLPGEIAAPVVEYAPEGLFLHRGFSYTGYGYNNILAQVPVNAPVPFRNDTEDLADAWSWKMAALEYSDILEDFIETDDVQLSDEKDFTAVALPDKVYSTPELVGAMQGEESDPYIWGVQNEHPAAFIYPGCYGESYTFTDGSPSLVTTCNPDNNIAYHPYLATPDVNMGNYTLSSLIFYQGKPTAPFYFEGVSMFVREFTPGENVELTCKIQKVTRDANGRIALGDVIAQSDLNIDDVVTDWVTSLNFTEFYVEDELGMSETVDYLQIEDEFAIVIDGWDNGTFTATPYVEHFSNTNGLPNTYFGMNDGIYSFTGSTFKGYVGYINAIYGQLYTEDDTDLHFEKAGGEQAIHVRPMFYNGGDAEQQTAIWLQEGCEIPEWLEVGIANEVYTEDAFGFDLVVKAAELTGEEYREAELVFEQWGAKLVVNVTQGDKAPVITINVEREVGQGYAATTYDADFTEAKAYLGVDELTTEMLRIVNPDGTLISDYATYDGWFNTKGYAETWSALNAEAEAADKAGICVKFFQALSNGKFEICDMNGADVVGAEYTVTFGLTANGKMATFPITVKFVEAEEHIYKPEIVKTIEISHLEKAATAYCEEEPAPKFDVAEVCEALGIASISEAKAYIVNLTDGNFVENTTDGWRNAAGDAAQWPESENGFCLKLDDPASGEFNYTGAHDANFQVGDTFVLQWGLVANEKAVVLKVTVTFVDDPLGIAELNADNQAGAIYNLNGVRVQTAKQKGVYIQNGKKFVIK